VSQVDAIEAAIAPTLDRLGFELVDVELVGSGKARTLRVSVDREGGVDLDAITEATRAVDPLVDRSAAIPGTYTLEVSSPGVERPLRRPEQFARALGETISIKSRDVNGRVVRRRATLTNADDDGIDLDVDGVTERVAHTDVIAARTMFEWGSAS